MSAPYDVVHLLPLAAKEVDADKVTPGLLGFVVFALIGLAAWGLMKSMNKQMKKISFEETPAVPRQPKPTEPAAAATAKSEASAESATADPTDGDRPEG
jgi:hypothetical protein